MNRSTLLVVAAAHLAALLLWHGIARAADPVPPKSLTSQCQCVDCDLDHNGRPSMWFDWRVLYNAFGKTTKDPGYSPRADFNRDGTVLGDDWSTMISCCGPPQGGN